VQVKILQIDRDKNKISLSRKATQKDPLMLLLPGEELDGAVESLADFGVFVKLGNGITGLIHISELSFKKFNHPSDLVKPGDPLRVKVLRVQVEDRRVSLSAKACERDPWSEVYSRFSVGQAVSGHVMQLLQSGVVLKLDEFFEAFVPISESSEDRINHPGDVLKEEEEASGVILSIDSSKRRIRVSLRRTEESMAEEAIAKPVSGTRAPVSQDISATAGKVTLGDILGGKLDLTAVSKKDEIPEEEAAVVEEEDQIQVVTETPPESDVVEDSTNEEPASDDTDDQPASEDEPVAEATDETPPDTDPESAGDEVAESPEIEDVEEAEKTEETEETAVNETAGESDAG